MIYHFKKNVIAWLLWFLLPIAMLCAAMAACGIYPFGAESFLAEDLRYQYVDFFAWFKRVLAGRESVFYSTACGLGANTWGLYSYYLASPFNLLLPFFDEAHLTLFVFVADALKLGCMQLAAMFYLRRRFDVGRGWSGVLALGYTWCLWTATNLRNPMWLDALIPLPLLMWAVWELVRRGRWLPLCLLTAADIVCCWYTAYMTVLFLILVAILEWWSAGCRDESGEHVPLWRLALRFARPMLLALVLCAWTFVPTVMAMLETGGVEETSLLGIMQSILGAGSLRKMMSKLFTTTPGCLVRGLVPALYDRMRPVPQFYCGLVSLGCLLGFFASRRVEVRAKRGLGVLIIFMLMSIILSPLQAIWCGFRAPTGFFSRVCIFVAPVVMWSVGWLWRTLDHEAGEPTKLGRIVWSRWGVVGCCAFVACDLALGAVLAWPTVYCDYTQEFHDAYVSQASQQLDDLCRRDPGTWRADRTFTRAALAALNDEMGRGYMGLSSYSSAHNQDALDFLSALGYSRPGQISVRYSQPILASDAFLGVKYVCSWQSIAGERPLGGIATVAGGSTYENPYTLGLGYQVSNDAVNAKLEGENPFERQNRFASALCGHEVNLFVPAQADEVATDAGSYAWDVSVPAGCIGYAYADVPAGYADGVLFGVDGQVQQDGWQFQQGARPFDCVEGADGGTHRVTMASNLKSRKPVPADLVKCTFYYLDLSVLQQVRSELAGHQATFDSFSGSGISGTVTADSDGWLMVSVPHEAGWTVTVNGAQVETRGAFGDALTLVPIAAGENNFEMTFVSPGFVPGCVLSAAGALGLAAWALWRRRRAGA